MFEEPDEIEVEEEEEIEDFYENDNKELSLPPVHSASHGALAELPPVKTSARPAPFQSGAAPSGLPDPHRKAAVSSKPYDPFELPPDSGAESGEEEQEEEE